MNRLKLLLSSGIGRKMLMAVTGLALLGFLVTHLSANLLALFSPEAFNYYGHALTSNPLIYVAEVGLIVLFVGHFVTGFVVERGNRAARPIPYQEKRPAGAPSSRSLASMTMILSGITLLIFVPLHIWTFKFGPNYDSAIEPGVRDLHRLMIEVFAEPLYVVWYVVALALLGYHAWHGFASAFESLGVSHSPALRRVGHVFAVVLAGGFIIIPITIYLGGGAQ
jgi:succinate dehydrogenase / fumarate reductase cytochrome b subunit